MDGGALRRDPPGAGRAGDAGGGLPAVERAGARQGRAGWPGDALLSPRRPFPDDEGEWSAWLAAGTDDDQAKRLRACTDTGRPCGSERFITRLERRLERTLRPQKRGRKPKDHGKE